MSGECQWHANPPTSCTSSFLDGSAGLHDHWPGRYGPGDCTCPPPRSPRPQRPLRPAHSLSLAWARLRPMLQLPQQRLPHAPTQESRGPAQTPLESAPAPSLHCLATSSEQEVGREKGLPQPQGMTPTQQALHSAPNPKPPCPARQIGDTRSSPWWPHAQTGVSPVPHTHEGSDRDLRVRSPDLGECQAAARGSPAHSPSFRRECRGA